MAGRITLIMSAFKIPITFAGELSRAGVARWQAMGRYHVAVAAGLEKDFNHANEDVALIAQRLHREHAEYAQLCIDLVQAHALPEIEVRIRAAGVRLAA